MKFSLRVTTWCEVRGCGFVILFSLFLNSGSKEGVFTETLHNQNRSIFQRLLHGSGVYFSIENGGKHAGGSDCWYQSPTHIQAHTQRLKSRSRQKAPFRPCHLILQQTQQKPERLIYFNLTSNASAAVPVCWGNSSTPELHQIFENEVTLLIHTDLERVYLFLHFFPQKLRIHLSLHRLWS